MIKIIYRFLIILVITILVFITYLSTVGIKTDKLNISEISYIIKNSKLFIGNESGPAVIASLFCKKNIIFV